MGSETPNAQHQPRPEAVGGMPELGRFKLIEANDVGAPSTGRLQSTSAPIGSRPLGSQV